MPADASTYQIPIAITFLMVLGAPFLTAAFQSAAANAETAIMLAKDGRAQATIVVSAEADNVVTEAVADLQAYIRKMSGAELPIAHSPQTSGNLILVGRMPEVDALIGNLDEMDLGLDGFVIKTVPGKLILTGKSDGTHSPQAGRMDCGTPNAVYYFLESLGCRWYAPGDDGEVVPRKPTIVVRDGDVVSKPSFASRSVGRHTTWVMGGRRNDSKVYKDHIKWLVRNRACSNGYSHGHTMNHLLRKTLFNSHPEYSALVDGKRRGNDYDSQFCMSNPEVQEIVRNNFTKIITRGPWKSFSIGQYDSWLWCQCEPCRAMYGEERITYGTKEQAGVVGTGVVGQPMDNVANGYLTFLNAIAAKVAKTNPDVLITYYALYNIPGFPEVKPRDNVLPVMCHVRPRSEAWRREVSKWEAMSTHLYYYTYLGHRLDVPKLAIAEDIRWCHQHKALGIYFEEDAHTPVNMVPQYLAMRVTWNIDTDTTKVLEEFYRRYYGAAAQPMRRLFEEFHEVTYRAGGDDDTCSSYTDALPPEATARFRRYIDQALRLADTPVVQRRVQSMDRYWRGNEIHLETMRVLADWRKHKDRATALAAQQAVIESLAYMESVGDTLAFGARSNLYEYPTLYEDAEEVLALPMIWDFKTDPTDAGLKDQWSGKEVDATWQKIRVDADWRSQGHNYYGVAWYHTDFRLLANVSQDAELAILFGAIDGAADIFLDGEKIGELKVNTGYMWNKPLGVALPAGLDRDREHHLTVRVEKRIFAAGIWQPVKIVKAPK